MSNIAAALGEDFVKLSGPKHFSDWKRQFKAVASVHGVWGFYDGTEAILSKPCLDDVLPESLKWKLKNGDQQSVHGHATTPTDLSHYKLLLTIHKIQLSEYYRNEESARLAFALLWDSVERFIWPSNAKSAATAWASIQADNESDAAIRLHRAYTRLKSIKFRDCKNVNDYLFRFDNAFDDIKDAGEQFTYAQLVINILRGLPPSYDSFNTHWLFTKKDINGVDMYREFCRSLVDYANDKRGR